MLTELFTDPAKRRRIGANGRRVVDMNRGSLLRLLELIEPMLAARREARDPRANAADPRAGR